jgi:uncharacterized phage infection (PIP) family protein YhgE
MDAVVETEAKPKKRKADLRTEIKNEAEAAKSLLANYRDVIADDDEAREDAIEGETNLKEAIGAAVARVAEIDAMSEAIKTQADKLRSRRDRLENQAELLRAAIANAMQTAEIDKLELPSHTLTIKATPAKATITDEAAIPSKFFVPQDPKLSLKAVGDALKAGETVPGATLSNGGSTLQIRGG